MKTVNIIMMWVCVALGVFFIGLFAYSLIALRQIDPVMIMYVIGAILTAKIFWKRYHAAGRGKFEPKRRP
jgi:putative effector of murein hydrolase